MKLTVFIAFIIFALGFAAIGFCQGGPPPKVKEKIGKSNEGVNPYVAENDIMDRFEKEFGVSRDTYNKVKQDLSSMRVEGGESGHDSTEKPTTEFMLILISATAQVTQGERTGKFKMEDRGKDISDEATKLIQRRRTQSGWGGIAEQAGFESPGALFAVQRAIEWGQPLAPDTKKKLVIEQTQTKPQ